MAQEVPGTCLPPDSFKDPVIVISNHNMKLSSLGKKAEFSAVREAFAADCNQRWNQEFIDYSHFWLDLGYERFEKQAATTLLRNAECNKWWTSQFKDKAGNSGKTTTIAVFPWAGTVAGSVTVKTHKSNFLHQGGLAYAKAYNVNKEQFATQLKGIGPYQDPLFEVLSYTQEQLAKWASLQKQGRWPSKLSRKLLLRHEQATKNRIYSALDSTRKGSFGDRQEFRILYEVFMLMPPNTSQIIRDSLEDVNNNRNAHRPYWCLATQDVNDFRIAECNRWILGLEMLASSAECQPGTNQRAY
ncbi:hypothetical protein EJ02DRAFT_429162 [Clathrospora elynae]|uniref:Uncharacterized protein n=1 Tax=Clathrospora elynae TaxID=706981 RepID=A0A6A5S586_9PLEO|nr:hypothetical protein EJ02DRAFT_429162 [Clathrospora elynae]